MNYFLLVLILMLVQCKAKDKPNESAKEPSQSSSRTYPAGQVPTNINPDECLLKASIQEMDSLNGRFNYVLKVENIIKKGFGFSKNLKKGDLLQARLYRNSQTHFQSLSPQKLKDGMSVILAVEYVPSLKNGYFQINNLIE